MIIIKQKKVVICVHFSNTYEMYIIYKLQIYHETLHICHCCHCCHCCYCLLSFINRTLTRNVHTSPFSRVNSNNKSMWDADKTNTESKQTISPQAETETARERDFRCDTHYAQLNKNWNNTSVTVIEISTHFLSPAVLFLDA